MDETVVGSHSDSAVPVERASKGFLLVATGSGLYALVSRTALPCFEEYRALVGVLLIREQCQEHCVFRWIPTTLMLADALTKVMDTTLLRTALRKGVFCLYDEESCLRYNAHRRDAISWLLSKKKD